MTRVPEMPAPNPLGAWRARMGLSQRAAAAALGITLTTYQQHERGRSWRTGEAVEPPATLLLACAAIEHGIRPIE